MSVRCRRADYDIGTVYSYGIEFGKLIDLAGLDLKKILHIRNFWLRHMMEPDEGSFYDSFAKLPEPHKPKGFEDILEKGSELRPTWLGYYCEISTPLFEIKDTVNRRQPAFTLNPNH